MFNNRPILILGLLVFICAASAADEIHDAAHAGDIIKGIKGAWEWDREMSTARKDLDWDKQIKLALDPQKAAQTRARQSTTSTACSMCGSYCAMELVSKYLGTQKKEC